MDSDPIPTEPTTDPEPPVMTPVVPGPSLASESPAAGRGRGSMLRRAAIGLALVVTFSVGIGVGRLDPAALVGTGSTTPAPGSSAPADFGLIREAWDTLHTKYVGADTLNDKELIYGAINGMTEAVGDTGHTSFMTPEQRAERSNDLSGKYVGIGVRIDTAEDGLPLVIGVFKGSPAEGAGIQAGDEIVAVDGQQTAGKTIDEIVDWVRGEAGTTVKVIVKPGANGAERELSMVRADVAVVPVTWAIVPGTQDRAGPPRPVLGRRGRRDEGGSRRDQGSRRGPDRPGPARQPGWLRQRGRRHRQPVPQERHRLHRARRGRPRDQARGRSRAAWPRTCRWSSSWTAAPRARRRSSRARSRTPDAPRSSGSRRTGPGRSSASSRSSDGSALRVGTVEWLTPEGRRIWHEGITPDVIVERPSDIAPLDPDQVGKMTPAQIAALTDPQLARALTLVTAVTSTGG